ncbi:hypothetical protein [Myxococcus sp. AM010]|uniref:hypothetical protein n=1 Tax=Myxococcus sp. AM010 TaxID=2745138 RepID=UPI001595DA9C|nr:hypothetical protein [Myxococcus sp. AM010]NVJ13141.1 hypothetical protein [Myxococcus sp. AM010]
MSNAPAPSKPSAPAYSPAPELVAAAERALATANPAHLDTAERMYLSYGAVTDGRSAVTGAVLPPFRECSVLVRAGWLAAARVFPSTAAAYES